ncbi:MAG: hypothetical protein K6D95_01060 [Treponema sp.]|nr:hypothetical protein [Treponema sp.]
MEWERQRVYDFEKGKEAGLEKGLEQGAENKAVEASINLLKMNVLTPQQIAQAEGLPLEKVLQLQAQLSL